MWWWVNWYENKMKQHWKLRNHYYYCDDDDGEESSRRNFFRQFFFLSFHIESEHNSEWLYIIMIIHLNNNNLYFRLCWKKPQKKTWLFISLQCLHKWLKFAAHSLSLSRSLSRLVVDLITIEKLFNLLLFFSHFVVDFKKTNIYKFDAKFYLIRCSKCIAVPRPSPSPRTSSKLNRN